MPRTTTSSLALLLFSTTAVTASRASFKTSHGSVSPAFNALPGARQLSRFSHPRALTARQYGDCSAGSTCQECFGPGNYACPAGSDYTCYDVNYGISDCNDSFGYGTSALFSYTDYPSATSDLFSDYPTATGSGFYPTSTDSCSYSSSCASCFGFGYIACPSDSQYCYDPSDSSTGCPDGTTGGTGGGSGGSGSGGSDSSNCSSTYGAGNIQCPPDGCYNPSIGESCCGEGYYCPADETCSSTIGYCCTSDSAAADTPGCSGSGGSGNSSVILTRSSTAMMTTKSIPQITQLTTQLTTQTTTTQSATSAAAFNAAPKMGGHDGMMGTMVAVSLCAMVVGGGLLAVV